MSRHGLWVGLGSVFGFMAGILLAYGVRPADHSDDLAALRRESDRTAAEMRDLARDVRLLRQAAVRTAREASESASTAAPGDGPAGRSPAPARAPDRPIYKDRSLSDWLKLVTDPATRDDTAEQLRAGDPESAELLIALLSARPSDAIYHLAASTLEKMGAPALPHLRLLLAEGDDRQRMQAAWLLSRVRPVEEESVMALAKALRDASNDVRMNVGATLRALGPEAAAAVPALIEALEKTTDYVRTRYVEAVGAIGPAAATAEPVLRRILDIEDQPFLRVTAATALFRIGVPAAEVLPIVIEAAQSGDQALRPLAISSLGQFGAEAGAAAGVLAKALSGTEPHVKMCAAEALGRIGPAAAEAIPALTAACCDGDTRVQRIAAGALRKVRGE